MVDSLRLLSLCKLSGVKVCTLFGAHFEYGPTGRLTKAEAAHRLDERFSAGYAGLIGSVSSTFKRISPFRLNRASDPILELG